MPWLQLTLATTKNECERLEQALLQSGALSVTYCDAADQPLLEPAAGETPLWNQILMVGLYPGETDTTQLQQQLCQLLDTDKLNGLAINPLEDRDWTRAWMDDFKPMQFGQRLWICPHGFDTPEPEAVNLRLDPGLAFGTGTHPTTALCLEWLDGHTLDNLEVIDFGCGSGVLAIAALLLGARHAWATDNDPQALIATHDNAEKNCVTDRITILPPAQLPQSPLDLLLANILAGPLTELAPQLAQRVKPGGHIILSGILREQQAALSRHYQQWFHMEPAVFRDDWVRLVGRRKQTTL